MKYAIFLTLSLWASTAAQLFSQASAPASCKYKHLTFYAERAEHLTPAGDAYTIYLVKDSLRQRIDTIGKFVRDLDKELCVCTDTSVAFYDNSASGIRSIKHYYLNNHQWNLTSPSLPEGDLDYVGMITPGQKYKSYNHRLITPEKAVSYMKLQIGERRDGATLTKALSLIGNYEAEFMLSPDKKSYVVSKETLKKE